MMDGFRTGTVRRQFDEFVRSATGDLLRTGYLMTWDLPAAEDLVQETLLRVARRWGKVRTMAHPGAYARRVLVNLALDGAKRRSRERDELITDDFGHSPDETAARAFRTIEDLAVFRSAFAALTGRQRAVLVLRYWNDLSEAEVAETLGCSTGTVKSTASRAAARLAGIMDRAGELTPSPDATERRSIC
jgi:RNA polymerase sigma-70 factor (sigma-E family)